jgi:cell fate regulator YaaT (PSP1 superfamily)
MNKYRLDTGSGCLCGRGCSKAKQQLNTFDWLADLPESIAECDLVEVQFKNTRKEFFRNTNALELTKGDLVAVEAASGHDIGTVSLTGKLAQLQMVKERIKSDVEIRRIYRIAKPTDLEKYEESKAKEHETMIRSRQIADMLGLQMKIGDVEYQGDGSKAIFYYIADDRVDFRQLIKDLAAAFHIRIEMKQIGARQEAGRIGGFGPCGRELCCASWMTRFMSVSTGAARVQDIALNPLKLAGQCAKLKCCMNFEVDAYAEAGKHIPPRDIVLETQDATYYQIKVDILSGQLTYSTSKYQFVNAETISVERAQEIIQMNRNGEKPAELLDARRPIVSDDTPLDLAVQESLTRFDRRRGARPSPNRNRNNRNSRPPVREPRGGGGENRNR